MQFSIKEVRFRSDRKAGHIVGFLPPDSPDLNSIGKKWAPAKSIRPKFGDSPEELFSDSNL